MNTHKYVLPYEAINQSLSRVQIVPSTGECVMKAAGREEMDADCPAFDTRLDAKKSVFDVVNAVTRC